jgi:hypothetical protein
MSNEYKLSLSAPEIDEKLRQISIPDYTQNDSKGSGYIKNRPFYVDEHEVIHKLETRFLRTSSEITENSSSEEVATARSVYNLVREEVDAAALKRIIVGDTSYSIQENKIVVPIATDNSCGVVKSSQATNDIAVKKDGTMEVNKININKIVQDSGDTLLLSSGTSKL